MDSEVWVDIEGYKGYYQISSFGNVRSLDRYVPCAYGGIKRVKSQHISQRSNKGYSVVNLNRDGVMKTVLVSRLVATHFIPNHLCKPEVNHIDEDKANNKITNLEWVTPKENSNHGTRNKRISEHQQRCPIVRYGKHKPHKKGSHAKSYKPVYQLDPDTKEIVSEYVSVGEALRAMGVAPNTGGLSRCLTSGSLSRTFRGYCWKYKQKE